MLRCPVIPGYNDRKEHFAAVGKLAEALAAVERVDIEPYHPLGKGKMTMLGKDYALSELTFPEEETVQEWMAHIAAKTHVPVKKA